jgi:DNA-binding CsgD family transcriptional regulator
METSDKIATERTWAADWLELQGQAVMVVDQTLRIVWRTSGTFPILDGDGPLLEREGRLQGANRLRQAQLTQLIERTAQPSGAVDLFDHSDPARRVVLHIRVLEGPEPRYALSFRVERAEPKLLDLGAAYGLTGAEQQVVSRLFRGRTPIDIAEDLGVTLLTARTHMKRAYSKLGVHSKEQLFARLMGYLVH